MNEVNIDGVAYEAVERQGCNGCAFRIGSKCNAPKQAPHCCIGLDAPVIFVKNDIDHHCYPFVECGDTVREPARPFIDKTIKEVEWDAKYEIFERHYPLIKWVVVAGLLGLVWLVSL